MSGICTDLDPVSIQRAQAYYEELLSPLSEHYDAFHRVIYQFLCIVGVIANICVIVVLLRPSMRKNSFNLFLVAIAICDMSLMASYFIYKQVEMCHPWYFTFTWIVYTYAYAVCSVFVHSASLWMTVNMAVLRYLVLRNSASPSRRWPRLNTYKAASMSIGAAVLIAALGSAPNMLRYQIYYNGLRPVPEMCRANDSVYVSNYTPDPRVHAYLLVQPNFWNCAWERFSFWTAGVLLKLVPCLLLTIFMTLLVRMLVEARERRTRLQDGGGKQQQQQQKQPLPPAAGSPPMATKAAAQQQQPAGGGGGEKGSGGGSGGGGAGKAQPERTTAMLTIIVAVFLITELPQGILVVAIGVKPQVRIAMSKLSNMIDLLSLLNSSVNFILYATMSNLFRHEFLQTFGQCCPVRFFHWLKKRHSHGTATEKSSPLGGPHTMMTGLNGNGSGSPGAVAVNSKLIRASTVDNPNGIIAGSGAKTNNNSNNFVGTAIAGGGSPAKLAITGQEISRIAQTGINNGAISPLATTTPRCRVITAQGNTTNNTSNTTNASLVKKQPIARDHANTTSLPGAFASAAVNLLKRAQEKTEADQAEEDEDDDQRRRLLLIENGGTLSAGTAAGTARRE